MKDYLWVSIAAIFALIALLFFALTVKKSSLLIKKLKKKKLNILVNFSVLVLGGIDIYFVVHLLMSVKEQLNTFNAI